LQEIVDAIGEAQVSKTLDWSRWTLRRKMNGKSGIEATFWQDKKQPAQDDDGPAILPLQRNA
jgi:hypothetical protein